MKNILTILLCTALPAFFKAQKSIEASISYATFQDQKGGGFVEVYLHVLGQSVGLKALPEGMGQQAALDVVILFKQGESIVKFDKYRLNGPTVDKPTDFVDMKRFALKNGNYKLEVSVEDTNTPGNARKYESTVSINYQLGELAISDIELLASVKEVKPGDEANPMAKGKQIFEPMPTNFYSKNDQLLLFYYEVYNADKKIDGKYLHSFYFDDADTKDRKEAISMMHKRKDSEEFSPCVQIFDIKELPSGNYNLVVEVKDKDRKVLAQRSIPFQRSNPYLELTKETVPAGTISLNDEFVGKLSVDELIYSLKAIMMHVDGGDGEHVKMITSERNTNAMRLYLLGYYVEKNYTDPEAAYNEYMKVARQVDVSFANGFGAGFETARGYTFLKYGPPTNTVFEENEPSAPPYEIWFYNQFPMTGQNNVKFLFYNPSLITNGHVLLHSTARGETNNPRWEVELYRAAPMEVQGNDYIDGTNMQANTGRHARQLFESF
jgi:GWxTD domain-containing protein